MHNHGPRIVTDQLIALWDVASIKSHPRTGTSWYDIVGGKVASQIDNAAYSSVANGSIVLDGTNDYCNTDLNITSVDCSVSSWFKAGTQDTNAASGIRPIFAQGDYGTTGNTATLSACIVRPDIAYAGTIVFYVGYGNQSTRSDMRYDDDVWHNVCLVKSGSTGYLYVDGTFIVQAVGGQTTINQATTFQIGGSSTISARKLLGSMATTAVYNKALSAQEVMQNYNAIKGRYL
jgi:hypothetical protein